MPTFVLLSTLTLEGRQILHKDSDRLEKVNQGIADWDATLSRSLRSWGNATYQPLSRPR